MLEKEAKYYIKTPNKWCCSKSQNSCPCIRKKFSESNTGKIISEETKEKMRQGNIGKKRSKETKKKISESRKKYIGENHPLYGKPCSELRKKRISESNKKWNLENKPIWLGRKHNEESKKKIGLKSIGRKQSEKSKESKRQRLLNGDSLKMIKAIKKISKPEIKLRDMIKELYSNCEFQYEIFNYSIDVAIPEYKIAIEYDGYYHFDSEKSIEYHKQRQEKIENEGWKFYRVTMFDKFPSSEKVKEILENLINGKKQ